MSEENKIDDGGPAFPLGSTCEEWMNGMTLRDYFAAKAMQGFNREMVAYGWWHEILDESAGMAYQIADAMLRARQK